MLYNFDTKFIFSNNHARNLSPLEVMFCSLFLEINAFYYYSRSMFNYHGKPNAIKWFYKL